VAGFRGNYREASWPQSRLPKWLPTEVEGGSALASRLASLRAICPDLAEVLSLWQDLPKEVKAAILTLLRATHSTFYEGCSVKSPKGTDNQRSS
jgi:hypothetical protein